MNSAFIDVPIYPGMPATKGYDALTLRLDRIHTLVRVIQRVAAKNNDDEVDAIGEAVSMYIDALRDDLSTFYDAVLKATEIVEAQR